MSDESVSVEVTPIVDVRVGQTLWAHNDGDWLTVRKIRVNHFGDVFVDRGDGSEASFAAYQRVLVRVDALRTFGLASDGQRNSRHHDFESIGGGGGWSMSRCSRCGEEGFGGCWWQRFLAFVLPRWFGCCS